MEEAMSHTEPSHYGTDDKVKLPNLTDEEVNWQGLEDLYSINESLYECRPDYSPSLDNWANFETDVDYMFALLLDLNKHNRTQILDDSTLPELGSGAGGGLDEGSGDLWPGFITEAPITTPTPNTTLPAALTRSPNQEGTLKTLVNELPESGRSEASPLLVMSASVRSAVWMQLEDMDGEGEEGLSGNGLTELETRHDHLLRTHNSLQLEAGAVAKTLHLGLDPQEEEDIFQAQGYLPFSPQTEKPAVKASPPSKQTSAPHSVGAILPLDFEGSGSSPQPTNQTL